MVLEVLSVYLIIHSYFFTKMGVPVLSVYAIYFLMCFDFNIVYAMRVIHILENKVELWKFQNFNFKESDTVFHEIDCSRVFQVYVEMFECYDKFKHNFQQFVSIWDIVLNVTTKYLVMFWNKMKENLKFILKSHLVDRHIINKNIWKHADPAR